jgi:hypothetical protein
VAFFLTVCFFVVFLCLSLAGNISDGKKLFVTRKNSPKGPAALSRYNIKATGKAGGYLL